MPTHVRMANRINPAPPDEQRISILGRHDAPDDQPSRTASQVGRSMKGMPISDIFSFTREVVRQTEKRDTSREQPARMGELAESQAGSHKTASSIVRQRETDDELLRAVAQLPARRRRIIELRHWQGLSCC